jgi:CyaY protein
MNESVYHQIIDDLFIRIEEALDELESVDIDYESAEGILTLILPKFNGYHFNYTEGKWIDERFGGEFYEFFNDAISKQAGQPIALNVQES